MIAVPRRMRFVADPHHASGVSASYPVALGRPQGVEAELLRLGDRLDLALGRTARPVADLEAQPQILHVTPLLFHLDDSLDMPLQGSTQWDGLAHVPVDDTLYNGFWVGSATSEGAQFDHIGEQRASFIGRGVLIDMARHLGVESVAPGHVFSPTELDAALADQGVEIMIGDVVLLWTGRLLAWDRCETDEERIAFFMDGCPGIGAACPEWIAEHDIVAMASDTFALEVIPFEDPDQPFYVHRGMLCDLGVTIGELWDLRRSRLTARRTVATSSSSWRRRCSSPTRSARL